MHLGVCTALRYPASSTIHRNAKDFIDRYHGVIVRELPLEVQFAPAMHEKPLGVAAHCLQERQIESGYQKINFGGNS